MKLAIFDFDGTLFLEQTIPFFLKQWQHNNYGKGKLLLVKSKIIYLYLKYRLKIISKEVFRTKVIEFFPIIFTGMDKKEINEYFNKAANNADKYFNKIALKELKLAQKDNCHTVLLSGCYTLFLAMIGEQLGIDTVLGTELAFNKKQQIDYQRQINHINGYKKAALVKHHFADCDIAWEKSSAYADSITDLELLELVGNPRAVKPDKELRKLAKTRDWVVLM